MIGFGGNAQDAEGLGQDLASDFPDLNVVVFHYRGFGPSTGRPSEAALLADALTIYDTIVARVGGTVYAIGISLGSAIAAYLSRERPLAGVSWSRHSTRSRRSPRRPTSGFRSACCCAIASPAPRS